MPLVKRWVICLCRTKSGKNGAHSCNGRHSRNANFISTSVYPVVWQQPSPCYCYFGPLGTSRTRTASCRTSKSSPPDTTTRLTLEDGSHVLLSANSRLEYPKEFSSQGSRTVNLTGEARFKVTKDAHRPFIVSADKMQTQVLGTVFDVNAYPGNAPAVTLYQGRVKVGKAASPIEKEIVPGQCATLTTSGDIRLAKATRTEKEGWTKDEFYYDNTEMITVLQNIGTWYNISVICHSADLLHKRVHFRFSRNVPIKTLLNVLNDLGIAHFQYKDKQIVVE